MLYPFARAGFTRVEAYFGARGRYVRLPIGLVRAYESLLQRLPDPPRRAIAGLLPVRIFLWPRIVGIK